MAVASDISDRLNDSVGDVVPSRPTVLGSKDRAGQSEVDSLFEVIGTRNATQPQNEFLENIAVEGTLVALPDFGE